MMTVIVRTVEAGNPGVVDGFSFPKRQQWPELRRTLPYLPRRLRRYG